jgi:hypothetical protein
MPSAVIEVTTPVGPVRLSTSARSITQQVKRLAMALETHRLSQSTQCYIMLAEPPWVPLFAEEDKWADEIMRRLTSVCPIPDRCNHGIQLATRFEDIEGAHKEAREFERWKNADRVAPTKASVRDWIERPR